MRYLSRAMKCFGQLHFGDISASLSTALGGNIEHQFSRHSNHCDRVRVRVCVYINTYVQGEVKR